MLTNPGTPMDKDGWADVLSDIRRLYLMIEGGANDLNANTVEANQEPKELKRVEVHVCVDGNEKRMIVMGTDPF